MSTPDSSLPAAHAEDDATSFLDTFYGDLSPEDLQALDEGFAKMREETEALMAYADAALGLTFETLGGVCPLQGHGTYQGNPFYFRLRGGHASLQVWQDRGRPASFYPTFREDPLLSAHRQLPDDLQGTFSSFEEGKEVLRGLVEELSDGRGEESTYFQQEAPLGGVFPPAVKPLLPSSLQVVERYGDWDATPTLLLQVEDALIFVSWGMRQYRRRQEDSGPRVTASLQFSDEVSSNLRHASLEVQEALTAEALVGYLRPLLQALTEEQEIPTEESPFTAYFLQEENAMGKRLREILHRVDPSLFSEGEER